MSYPRLYVANAAVSQYGFENLGLGTLSDAISCTVTEERNGKYELEMEYPVGGIHFSDITVDRLIMCKANESSSQQIFRIYKIEKPIDGTVTVYAEHISYLLSNVVVMPFAEVNSATEAFNAIKNNLIWQEDNANFPEFPFIFDTDNTDSGSVVLEKPSTVRSLLGGTDGSILDAIGGEYEFNNFTVKLWKSRGSDKDIYLRYGKNITDLTDTSDISSVYTGIVPYWKGTLRKKTTDSDGNESTESYDSIVYLNDKVLWSDNTTNYAYPLASVVDFSSNIDSDVADVVETNEDGNEETTYYTTEDDIRKELQTLAENYISTNKGWEPSDNIEVSFINLWDTQEYKNFSVLQRVNLCDTVHVIYQKLGVEVTMKVITTEYNVLLDRYDSIELGEPKSSFTTSVANSTSETDNKIQQAVSEAKSEIQKAKDESTDFVNGKLNNLCGVGGGYVYFNRDAATGKIDEIYIADKEDRSQNLIRMNMRGIYYSTDGGQTYHTGWRIDGVFYADCIAAGTLKADIIKTGYLSDVKGNFYLDMVNGNLVMKNGEFQGKITSESGKIGGFVLTNSALEYNKTGLGLNAGTGVYIGTGGISIGNVSDWGGCPVISVDTSSSYKSVMISSLRFYRNGGESCGAFMWTGKSSEPDWLNWNNNLEVSGHLTCNDIEEKGNSDERLKQDIETIPLDESKRLIMGVTPKRFRFKDRPEKLHHGLIAQDVLKHTSDEAIVHLNDEYYGLQYKELIADLINVVQDQEKRIRELEEKLNANN